MKFKIKEIFYSIAGEGAQAGRATVFCRFSQCNLWKGTAESLPRAECNFCDTDFVGTDGPEGGEYSRDELIDKVESIWQKNTKDRKRAYVVLTGGEPAIQVSRELVEALQSKGFWVGIETNGTLAIPENLDWVCVSPKVGTRLKIKKGDEIKLVYPQVGVDLEKYGSLDFKHFFLQPKATEIQNQHFAEVIDYCLKFPQWRVSLQAHKIMGLK